MYTRTSVAPRFPGDFLPPDISPPRLAVDYILATLTPRLQYDNRDNEFNINHYRATSDQATLASRLHMRYAAGAAPYFLYPAFGQGADLRGYQTGTYRDRFMIALQAEYRYRFAPRWGAVAFAGVGSVSPDFGNWGKSLPSAGIGLRWVVAPQNDISLRFDIAKGKDDTIWYVGVGEAF